MTVLPLVGRTADSGNLLFLVMLVAISAVMLCVNILNQKNPVRVNIIDLILLLFCSYVLVMGREAWYDTEEHIIDVTMHSNRNRGCTTGITKSIFVKSINSDYLYVKFKNLRLW